MGGDHSWMHTGTTGFHFSGRESNGKWILKLGAYCFSPRVNILKVLVKHLVQDEK